MKFERIEASGVACGKNHDFTVNVTINGTGADKVAEVADLINSAPDLLKAAQKTVLRNRELCRMVNSFAKQLGHTCRQKVYPQDWTEDLESAIAQATGRTIEEPNDA